MAVEGEFWGVFGNLVEHARRPSDGCNRNPGMRRSAICDGGLSAGGKITYHGSEETKTRNVARRRYRRGGFCRDSMIPVSMATLVDGFVRRGEIG